MGLTAALVAALAAIPSPQPAATIGRLRPGGPELTRVITQGSAASETFRGLVNRINDSTTIVFVRFGRCDGNLASCLHLLTQGTPARVLRVTLDPFRIPNGELIPWLGHELQHAIEIDDDPTIVDASTFKRSYEDHGRRNFAGYETDHAQATTRAIARELASKSHW